MSTFSLADARNEAGEWLMSPEQIRAEMAYEPDDLYHDEPYDDDPGIDPDECTHAYGQNRVEVDLDENGVPEWVAGCPDCGESIRADVTYGPRTEDDYAWNAGLYPGEREYGGATDYALTWRVAD